MSPVHSFTPNDRGMCQVCNHYFCDYSDLEDRIDRRARMLGLSRREFLATEEGQRAMKAADVS